MRANRTLRFFAAHIRKFPQLTLRERIVLVSRLKTVTLEKIGNKFEVTEARIRQIEKKALQKIKNKNYQQRLFDN